jgi:glycosyltransferase involved in cell wall biosynthesis
MRAERQELVEPGRRGHLQEGEMLGARREENVVGDAADEQLIILSDDESDAQGALLPSKTLHERRPKVSVVIPALNEADNLAFILPLLPPLVDEVILVDGRSTDGTVEVARRLYPSVRLVEQIGDGKGNALNGGFRAATGDVIVMLDADGSADPGEIPRFLEALEQGAQFAKGTRFAQGGGSQDITRLRRAGNAVLTRLVNLLYGTKYSDLCYGYNAFLVECLPQLNVDCNGFEVETLINVRLAKAGLRVTEVPSFEHARISGRSNLNAARDGWRVLRTILSERFNGASSRIDVTQTAKVHREFRQAPRSSG